MNDSNQKYKIAVIGLKGLPGYGGAAAVGENIIYQLYDKYDFTVFATSSHTNLKSGVYKGICFQRVIRALPFKRFNAIYYYICSCILVLFSRFDLIHLHHRDASFIIPLLRIKYKVLLTTHGMVLTTKWDKYKALFNIQDMIFLRFADAISTVSKKDFQIVKSIIPHKVNLLNYIPNGVSILEQSFTKNNSIVFAAGRIIPDKGCHIFLEALVLLGQPLDVKIIGDNNQISDYFNKITKIAKKIDKVEFLGLIKQKEELFSIIGSSKLFIYPSRIESMSMMMLETASLMVPIVCSRIPENEDVFCDSEVLFFKPDDSLDLCHKISWALKNEAEMKRKAALAKARLKKDYLWVDIAKKYDSLFQKLI